MPPRPAIDLLPESVKDELNEKLIANGFGNLVELSGWLAEQGYQISKSAVGVYSQGLKSSMEKSLGRARERMAIAKALKGASDEDKAALMEANEMVAMDQIMDMFDLMGGLEPGERMAALPKLVRAVADLNRSAVGSAKWKREFEAEIREKAKLEAAEAAAKTAKDAGVSAETIARIRRDVLGMAE